MTQCSKYLCFRFSTYHCINANVTTFPVNLSWQKLRYCMRWRSVNKSTQFKFNTEVLWNDVSVCGHTIRSNPLPHPPLVVTWCHVTPQRRQPASVASPARPQIPGRMPGYFCATCNYKRHLVWMLEVSSKPWGDNYHPFVPGLSFSSGWISNENMFDDNNNLNNTIAL